MKSVKGMTVCTPEFHKVAKEAEERAEVSALLKRIQSDLKEVMSAELTGVDYDVLCDIRHYLEEAL